MRESRMVFGDCAIALHWVACALDSLRIRLTAYGGGFFESEQRAKPYEDLDHLGQQMDALARQLSITLGDEHEALVAFGSARAAVGDVVETVGLLRDPSRPGAAGISKLVEETIAHVEGQRERFDASRDQFMAATRDLRGED